MLSPPKIFYQSRWLSSPWSNQVVAGIHGQESAIPKQCQGLPAKQGKLGRCGSEWERAIRKYVWSYWKYEKGIKGAPSPFHRPTSSQRVFSTTPAHFLWNNLLCPCRVYETQESSCLVLCGQANHCGLHRKSSRWICTRRHDFIDPHPSLVNRNNWGFILICVGCFDVIKSSSRCVQCFVNKEIIGL